MTSPVLSPFVSAMPGAPILSDLAGPHERQLLHYSAGQRSAPEIALRLADADGYEIVEVPSRTALDAILARALPAALLLDLTDSPREALDACVALKADTFTAGVPIIAYHRDGGVDLAPIALEAGVDEIITSIFSPKEAELRFTLAIRRAERDISVQPSTRLPGTVQIERNFAALLQSGAQFAVCYADLDHFKEYNDRYGYERADRAIRILSRILHQVVRTHASNGFVGHIGGDDFIFTLPAESAHACCQEVLASFDAIIREQYTPEDREQGWFIGADRRGNQHQVPLMSLSIGVVTNQKRTFQHPAEISALAAEMKTYAKTIPGSVYVVDRRSGT